MRWSSLQVGTSREAVSRELGSNAGIGTLDTVWEGKIGRAPPLGSEFTFIFEKTFVQPCILVNTLGLPFSWAHAWPMNPPIRGPPSKSFDQGSFMSAIRYGMSAS